MQVLSFVEVEQVAGGVEQPPAEYGPESTMAWAIGVFASYNTHWFPEENHAYYSGWGWEYEEPRP